MRFEVFRQEKRKDYHKHVGDVHAPNMELAKQYAQVMHARRKPANSLWVVPKEAIGTVEADEIGVEMGGTTQKEYRWATNFSTGEMAQEIEDSQREQEDAERDRKAAQGSSDD
jgi:ring-1,2-phenylacetyl-CoA epoxidase subunit PaaB